MISDCVFCKISNKDISVKNIYENDSFISFPDANPKIAGHSLVIPKKHYETFLDIPISLGQELIDCIKNTSIKIMNETKAEGFNIVSNNFSIAGQAIKHLHFHILPRKHGDSLGSLWS